MVDNVTLNSGSGGDTIAADDVGGAKHQRVKVEWGPDGTINETDAASGKALPIQGEAAENAAVTGNPVQVGGRFDSSARTLGNGDVGAIALAVDGAVHIDDGGNTITVDGTVTADAGTGPWPVTDNGGSLTVDGTVDLGATDNAVLDQIETNTSYGDNVGNGTAAGALRVTVASDTTGVLSVDDNGGTLTVDGTVTANLSATDNAVLDNIDTNTTNIPNVIGTDGGAGPSSALSVAGTESGGNLQELRVDSDGHLQIDVLSGGGGGTQYSVDDAAGGTDTGTLSLAVRDDALTTLTPIDGDYTQLRTNSTGALWVKQDGDVNIADGGNTITVDGTVTADLGATDNAVLDQIETNTSYGDNVGNGTAAGSLRVTVASDTTGVLSVDDNGASLTVDNADITTIAGAVHAEDSAHTSTDSGIQTLAVRNDDLDALAGADGDYAPLQVTQNGALLMCPAANDDYKYAVINDSSSGDNTIIAAVASRKIRVLAAVLVAAGDVTVRFESGASGTALTGVMDLTTNSGFTLPYNPAGWFETAVNTLLNIELSAAVAVAGSITYIEVP